MGLGGGGKGKYWTSFSGGYSSRLEKKGHRDPSAVAARKQNFSLEMAFDNRQENDKNGVKSTFSSEPLGFISNKAMETRTGRTANASNELI